MHTKASTGKIPQTYEFIKAHRKRFNVRTMCRVLEVAPSGYYAWLREPVCQRALEDVRLLRLIRASFAASHGIYGAFYNPTRRHSHLGGVSPEEFERAGRRRRSVH